jgi:hypothetical protein
MEKGKMMDWATQKEINITKMEINEKGNYRIEVKEFPNTYFVSKPNPIMDSMYNDFKVNKKVSMVFDQTNSQPNGYTRIAN